MQHGKAVPVRAHRSDRLDKLGREPEDGRAVLASQSALPDDDERTLGLLQNREEVAVSGGEILQRLCA